MRVMTIIIVIITIITIPFPPFQRLREMEQNRNFNFLGDQIIIMAQIIKPPSYQYDVLRIMSLQDKYVFVGSKVLYTIRPPPPLLTEKFWKRGKYAPIHWMVVGVSWISCGSSIGPYCPYILKSNRGDFVAYLGHTDTLTDTCLVFVLQLQFRTDLVSCYDC